MSIRLTGDGMMGSTSVSNVFIDYYMKKANDAQIKVYLYLLRNASCGGSFEIGDIADEFNHTEKDVIRSLKYWEKEGLISLLYDASGEICNIELISGAKAPSVPMAPAVPMTQAVPMAPIAPMAPAMPMTPAAQMASVAPILSIVPAPAEKNEPAKPAVPEKPSYSADDLKAFKEEEGIEELVCIAESYLVKTIGMTDLKSLLYIHRELNFSCEMIDLLLQYCVSKNKKSIGYAETVAVSWYEQGITTPAQAKTGISRYDKNIFDVMTALGKSNTPTIKETEFINRWYGTYGFSKEVILAACERTVMKTDSDRFAYTEGILSKWRNQGITTPQQVEEAENEFRKKKSAAPRQDAGTDSKYNSFSKTKYDFAALQKFINDN